MDNKEAKELLEKYLSEAATPEECRLLENWYLHQSQKTEFPMDPSFLFLKEQIWQNTLRKAGLEKENSDKNRLLRSWIIKVAAVLVIMAMVGVSYRYLIQQKSLKQFAKTTKISTGIQPGKNKAILTLPDGTRIDLDGSMKELEASAGQLRYSNGKILLDSSQLAQYGLGLQSNQSQHIEKDKVALVMISVPRGGQYNLRLPDGSKVCMNAASSLKYPIAFTNNQRSVELTGEAYFEVTRDKTKPFIVKTENQQIEVLGTHFNINAYQDEPNTRTTLVKGSVKVTTFRHVTGQEQRAEQIILKPGQQSVVSSDRHIKVNEVDADDFIAWQTGYFQFNYADLQSVMREISRWYNVEVVYKGNVPKKAYTGRISRDVGPEKLIEMLNYLGINCHISNEQIVVQP